MKRNTMMLALTLVLSVVAFTGCQTNLDKEGIYKGDKVLYNSDKTITTSYRVLHAFVKWEMDYRELLPPEVTKAADAVRRDSRKWINSAIALREAYAINPSEENKLNLQKSLEVLDVALAQISKYMAANQVKFNEASGP